MDQKVVLNQLRCNGTIEAVEVLKVTYPTRFSFAELHKALAPKFPKLHQVGRFTPPGIAWPRHPNRSSLLAIGIYTQEKQLQRAHVT